MNDNNITALRRQLQQLQAQHETGALDAPAYAAAKAALERQLLDSVLAEPAPTPTAAAAAAQRPRPAATLVALLCVGVLALAAAGYSYTGAPGATVVAAGAAAGADGQASPGNDEQQFAAAVEELAQRLKGQPDNTEGFAMLARAYARLGRQEEARSAFQKTGALLQTDARLLADYADTLGVINSRSLQGEPMQLIERALKLEPNNLKALALAGTAAFEQRDYPKAVRYWEQVVALSPESGDFVAQLQDGIAQARRLGGLPAAAAASASASAPSLAQAAPAVTSAPNAAVAATAKVQGSVRLSPALAQQVQPGDTVFIFARAAEGPRMPLAILRHQVKDLPLTFTLDDSLAMSPAMRMSMHASVVISARISKSGQAMPSTGDLVGQSAPVANTASGVNIEINEVVKN